MKKLLYILISTSNLLLLGSQKNRKFMKDSCNRTYWDDPVGGQKEHDECIYSRFEVYDEDEKKYIAHIVYSPSDCYIGLLRVSEEYKKQGLGSELAKRALEDLRNSGCREVFLVPNSKSEGFWKKLGAKSRGDFSFFFPDSSSNLS